MLAYSPPHRQLDTLDIYRHQQQQHQLHSQPPSAHTSPSTASSASSAASPSLPWLPYSDPFLPSPLTPESSLSTFVFDDIFQQIVSAAESDAVAGVSGGGYTGSGHTGASSLMAQHQHALQQQQQQQQTGHSQHTHLPSIRFDQSPPSAQHSTQSPPQFDWNLFGEDDPHALLQARSQPAPSHHRAASAEQIILTSASPPPIVESSYPDDQSGTAAIASAFSKSLPTPSHTPQPESFLTPLFPDFNSQETPHNPDSAAAKLAMYQQTLHQHHQDSPSPNFSTMSGRRSISTAGQSSPLTPQTAYGDDFDETLALHQGNTFSPLPKFQTNLSEAGHDDYLFSTSVPHGSGRRTSGQALLSPYQSTFNNTNLAAAARSPRRPTSRDASQYQRGPAALSPTSNRFGVQQVSRTQIHSTSQLREIQKAEAEAEAIANLARSPLDLSAPNTISPKNSILDYRRTAEDTDMPLFPPESASSHFMLAPTRQDDDMIGDTSGYLADLNNNNNFRLPALPGSTIQVPQHYPFIQDPQRNSINASQSINSTPEFPAHLTSMETSVSDVEIELQQQQQPQKSSPPKEARRPDGNNAADSGTYTCTYHGCPLRFETPAKLQKHKREGHRQLTPGSAAAAAVAAAAQQNRAGGATMTPTIKLGGSQAGPHKCERINPSTNKRCNTVFSRPYDLTRHEHTIHNVRKQKSRCPLCSEEKTFSRNDALTRHMRVVHPEFDFNPKLSRRGSR